MSREERRNQDTSVLEIDSRAAAQLILDSMLKTIDEYDVVTLAEFYQLADQTPDHTDYKFGWEDLGGAKIIHSHGAYYLDLPKPIALR